jgi:hypothetical protein
MIPRLSFRVLGLGGARREVTRDVHGAEAGEALHPGVGDEQPDLVLHVGDVRPGVPLDASVILQVFGESGIDRDDGQVLLPDGSLDLLPNNSHDRGLVGELGRGLDLVHFPRLQAPSDSEPIAVSCDTVPQKDALHDAPPL